MVRFVSGVHKIHDGIPPTRSSPMSYCITATCLVFVRWTWHLNTSLSISGNYIAVKMLRAYHFLNNSVKTELLASSDAQFQNIAYFWKELDARVHTQTPVSYTHLTLPTNREV